MTIHAATSDEKAYLRTKTEQWSKLYIAGLVTPPIVFAAQVNQVFESHAAWNSKARDEIVQITYNNVTTGAYTDIVVGMTLWIGSAAGLCDIGQARIRKTPTSAILYIGEESDIDWDNLYLTVIDEMGLWAKHVRIVSSVPYMDYDVAYSDQHDTFDPIPVMGSDVVLDVAAYPVSVTFPESADSWVPGDTTITYSFASTAGVWTNPTTTGASLAISSYPANGLIRVALTVTSGGKSTIGYRYIYVYDATHRPPSVFTVGNISGDYASGGWSFDVTALSDATNVRDRAKVILFASDYYNGTKVSIGQSVDRENIVCIGWIDGESIEFNRAAGGVNFTVQGPQFWLGKMPGFPPGVEMQNSATGAWTQIPGLTVDRALWHLLHWRSTASNVMDIRLTGNNFLASAFEVPTESLWAQMVEIASTSILAVPGCDKLGRLFVEVEPQFVPVADRTWTEVMTLTEVDWIERINFERKDTDETAMLDLSGVAVPGISPAKPYFSLATGHIFLRYGGIEILDRLLLDSQAQSNELAGLVMGHKNNKYPDFVIDLSANNRLIDLFPRQYCNLAIAAGDTLRGKAFSGRIIPRSISMELGDGGALLPSVTFEAESFPTLAITGDPPIVNPVPPSPPTPPAPPVPPGPPPINEDGPHEVMVATTNYGILYSINFHEAEPEWFFMNGGMSADQYQSIMSLKQSRTGLILAGSTNVPGVGPGSGSIRYLFASYTLGGDWYILADHTTVDQGTYGTPGIVAFGVMDGADQVLMIGGGFSGLGVGTKKVYLGSGGGLVLSDSGNLDLETEIGDVSYQLGKWFACVPFAKTVLPPEYVLIGGGGAVEVPDGQFPSGGIGKSQRQAGGKIFVPDSTYSSLRVISDNDPAADVYYSVSFQLPGSLGHWADCTWDADPTGVYLMAAWGIQIPKISSDGGATWADVASVDGMSPSYKVIKNCGNAVQWLAAAPSLYTLKLTLDAGASWIDKVGNLSYVAPNFNISSIIVIG